jgi:hypothetical protein
MGAKMLKFPIVERQEINLVFKIKVFVGSKIWYFNKFYLFLFSKKIGLLHQHALRCACSVHHQLVCRVPVDSLDKGQSLSGEVL